MSAPTWPARGTNLVNDENVVEADGAAQCSGTIESALGPTQNLNTLQNVDTNC
jgi:hypothetical protein